MALSKSNTRASILLALAFTVVHGIKVSFYTQENPVMCETNDLGAGGDAVYRRMGGKLHWYPNQKIADSWDPEWRNTFVKQDCQRFSRGADMQMSTSSQRNFGGYNNGYENKPVKCVQNDVGAGGDAVYRRMGGELRWYPDQSIASSWDPEWKKSLVKQDCQGFSRGADMQMKSYYNNNW